MKKNNLQNFENFHDPPNPVPHLPVSFSSRKSDMCHIHLIIVNGGVSLCEHLLRAWLSHPRPPLVEALVCGGSPAKSHQCDSVSRVGQDKWSCVVEWTCCLTKGTTFGICVSSNIISNKTMKSTSVVITMNKNYSKNWKTITHT